MDGLNRYLDWQAFPEGRNSPVVVPIVSIVSIQIDLAIVAIPIQVRNA